MANDRNPPETPGRWEGYVDTMIAENTRRLDGINGSIKEAARDVGIIRTEITAVKTRVAVYAALGGLIGSGAIAVVVALVTGGG